MEESTKRSFVNSRGDVIHILPVQYDRIVRIERGVERRFRERGEAIDPPTYEAELPGGEKEVIAWDEVAIEKDGTPEDKEVWAIYQATLARMKAEQVSLTTRYVLLKGIDSEDPPQEWIDESQYLGLDLPEDPRDLKLDYIVSEKLPTAQDVSTAIGKSITLGLLGVVDEEGLEAMEATFQRAMENIQDRARAALAEFDLGDVQ